MQRVRYQSFDGVFWGELEGGKVFQLNKLLGERTGHWLHLSEVNLLPPCDPRTIVCVGRNYAKHIKEMGGDAEDLPKEPGLFLKALNTLRGSGDPIPYPSWTSNLHYEGELAVVISRRMKQVSEEDALAYVLGYTCACDVTARDKQRSDLQWTRGKSADGFCPVGPWLETDLDPANLSVQTYLNGELKQDGHTRDFIFSVPSVLAYISSFMTLEPGDLVLTGTPDGVGPLKPGDTVEVTIENIGTLTNTVEAEA
jgi:2-keto-4-pentenoate hydratase/2-oxohepta-3-ene-1,7-dioic acid hydratase in catechol pathway